MIPQSDRTIIILMLGMAVHKAYRTLASKIPLYFSSHRNDTCIIKLLILLSLVVLFLYCANPFAQEKILPLPKLIEVRNVFAPENHNPLMTSFIVIHYANAENIAKFIQAKSTNLLSSIAKIQADKRTNTLWIRDNPRNIRQIKNLISYLDKPLKQVLIRARIINIDKDYTHTLGVLFHTQNQSAKKGNISKGQSITFASMGNIAIPIINLKNDNLLNLQLNALEKKGHAELISSPELMASNRQTALIESGDEIPFQQQTANGGTSVTFKKAVLRLKVTPEIMPNEKILLHLAVNEDKVSSLTVQGAPAIRTQFIETEVLVKNHQTFVLGGIFEENHSNLRHGVAFLHKIPLLGGLFRHKTRLDQRKELFIFVTPQIILEHANK